MLLSLVFSTLIFTSVGGIQDPAVPTRNFVHAVYDYDKWFTIVLNETTEQILDFHEADNISSRFPSRVHVTATDDVTEELPLLITATQQKGASAWELPLAGGQVRFFDMARTLCPHDAGPNLTIVKPPRLEMSTSNPYNVSVRIKLRRVNDFYLELDQERVFNVTAPGTPKYYYFSFDTPVHGPESQAALDSILLTMESDNQVCAVISIQNNSCPVFDNEHEIMYQGYHLTMTTKGGITLTRAMFPRGFYAVFVVKQSDGECTGDDDVPTTGDRSKTFRIRAESTPTMRQYMAAGAALLAVPLVVYCFNLLLLCCSPEEVLVEELGGIPSATSEPLVSSDESADSETSVLNSVQPSVQNAEEQLWSAPTLQQLCRAQPRLLQKQANRYVWSASTLAVVYTLPVLQLLITYQNLTSSTGDQELCYYNSWCARPLAGLADGNHVLSNLPYVLLGVAFINHVGRAARETRGHARGLGVPAQHGLMHALGVSLAMEGVLSACYHLCPNKMNFQFDSSFMYVMSVLWLAALHRRRLADRAPAAHHIFALIAGLLVTGVFGIVFPTLWFWILFTIAHLAASLFITLHLYYYGQFKLERRTMDAAWRVIRAAQWRGLLPRSVWRAAVLLIVNIFNWALAAYGLYWQQSDFARHLLGVLLGNTLLFSLLYVCCKLGAGERLGPRCLVLLAASAGAWAIAIAFFLQGHSKWRETPAHSRAHNAHCLVLGTFDTHDVWHAASAAALYLSFSLLLHIDAPLAHTPRHRIAVF